MSKNRTIAKDVTFRMKESVKLRKQKKVGTVTHGVNGSMCRMSLSRQETVQKNRKNTKDVCIISTEKNRLNLIIYCK